MNKKQIQKRCAERIRICRDCEAEQRACGNEGEALFWAERAVELEEFLEEIEQ